MKGYRTYFFAVLAGVMQISMILGFVTTEESTKIVEACQALSIALTAVFMRIGVKNGS